MPNMNVYKTSVWDRLSYAQTDIRANFIQDTMCPPRQSPQEYGEFRETAEQSYFKELDAARLSKYDIPQHYSKVDAIRYYHNYPIGAGFTLSKADLDDPKGHGYMSIGDWIEDYRQWITKLLKKFKEKALYTIAGTTGNYESASYYADASADFANIGTCNLKDYIETARLVVDDVSAMSIGYRGLRYMLNNQTFLSQANVTAQARDDAEVTASVIALKDYLELDRIYVSRGKLQTDSADSTDTTRADIWGDKLVWFNDNPNPSPMDPGFLVQNYWAPMGKGRGTGGWFWNIDKSETRSGGVGSIHYDLWNYYEIMVQEATMGYLLYNLY